MKATRPKAPGVDRAGASLMNEPTVEVSQGPGSDRLEALGGRGLRVTAARGVIINSAFRVGLAGLSLSKQVLVAIWLTTADYGLWALIAVAVGTIIFLKQVGLVDKYVQQSDEDQEHAFQRAFTLELLYTLCFFALIAVAVPLFALLYGRPDILVPAFVLSTGVLFSAFQTPQWIYFRRMQYARQRSLEAVDPVVAFVVTIALAAAGASYWSLVIGIVAGSAAAALVAVLASPYRLRLRYDRRALRDYFDFSWPLLVVSGTSFLIVQVSVIVGEETVGLTGVAVIALVGSIIIFTAAVNRIVTQTIYPAVCAVQHRLDLLFESFTKTNRLALMWGIPFGVGLSLFASDLVHFVLGEKWETAIAVLQAFGLIAAANQLGANWSAFMRARNETRPLAINGVITLTVFIAVGVPLMFVLGMAGYVIGMAAAGAVQLATRTYYLKRLFAGFGMLRHSLRAIAPALPAAGVVLLVRALEPGDRPLGIAIGELVLYAVATVAMTMLVERRLLGEMWGYLRGRGIPLVPAAR